MPPAAGGSASPVLQGFPSRLCWGGRRGFWGLPAPPPSSPVALPTPPPAGPSRPLQQLSPALPARLLQSLTLYLHSPPPPPASAPCSLPAPLPLRPAPPQAPPHCLASLGTTRPPTPSPSPPHSVSVPITLSQVGRGARLGRILCLSVRLSVSVSLGRALSVSLSPRLQFLVTRQCRAKLCLSSLPPHPSLLSRLLSGEGASPPSSSSPPSQRWRPPPPPLIKGSVI